MRICLRRREFIAALGGAAAWPLAARGQQGDRVRRLGMLLGLDENEPLAKPLVSAFTQALADLGWTDGRNVRMDLRWGGGDINRIRALAQELIGLQGGQELLIQKFIKRTSNFMPRPQQMNSGIVVRATAWPSVRPRKT
jgi:hypothetical protein